MVLEPDNVNNDHMNTKCSSYLQLRNLVHIILFSLKPQVDKYAKYTEGMI